MQEWDDWLQQTLSGDTLAPEERKAAFSNWAKAPEAKYAHPREEHLLPAHVLLGSAKNGRAKTVYKGNLLGAAISSYQWD